MIRQDQITQAALDYCRQYKDSKLTAENAALIAFSDGAQWADRTMIEKAVKWLEENCTVEGQCIIKLDNYIPKRNFTPEERFRREKLGV